MVLTDGGARPRVTVLSRAGRSSLLAEDLAALERSADVEVVATDEAPDHDRAQALLASTDVLATTNRCLPELDDRLLGQLPRLATVVLLATGTDRVDLAALARHGVTLSHLPDYATTSVAEHAIGMMLALSTRLHLAVDVARGAVPSTTSLRGVQLAGRTMGVLGVGRIGSRVATLGRALGMHVIGHDRDPRARAAAAGVEMVGREELLRRSQVLQVCASGRRGAAAIVGAAELAALPPQAWLVNVARAALVDTAAVVQAVRARRLRGYAVDDVVLDPDVDGDLLAEGRVVQTNHSAWWTDEALARGRREWGAHLRAAVDGTPRDVVSTVAAAASAS